MSVTILETLENANYNLKNFKPFGIQIAIAREQLNNAVTLLYKGYNLYDEVEPLLEKYGSIENVPETIKES